MDLLAVFLVVVSISVVSWVIGSLLSDVAEIRKSLVRIEKVLEGEVGDEMESR